MLTKGVQQGGAGNAEEGSEDRQTEDKSGVLRGRTLTPVRDEGGERAAIWLHGQVGPAGRRRSH